jgi:outer membrane biogenesis lipoprotein LolB
MLRRFTRFLLLICVGFLLLSCAKIEKPREPTLTIQKLTKFDSIPLEWGNFVFVSNRPDIAHVYNLWFEDKKGTIRVVKYNNNTDQILPKVVLISRK